MKNIQKKIILSIVAICIVFAGVKAEAQSVTSAVLNASVNPGGTRTTAWFEYGTNPNLNTWTETEHQLVGTFNYAKSFSQTVYNLQPYTTYYFRVVTNNGYSTYKAGILSFTTGTNNTTNQTTSYNYYNDGYNYTDQNTVNVTRYVVNETKYVDRVVQPQTVYTTAQPQTVSYQPVSYQPISYQPVAYQPVSYQTVAYQPVASNVMYQPVSGQVASPIMASTGFVPATTYNRNYTTPTVNSTLAAAPVLGASFLPGNLFGWLILIVLILGVVLVVRRLARV